MSAYQIIKFEEMEDIAQRAIEKELEKELEEEPEEEGIIVDKIQDKNDQNKQDQDNIQYCTHRNPNIAQGQKIPFGLPVNTDDMTGNFSNPKTSSILRNTNRGLFCSPYGCGRGRPHQGIDIGCTEDFYQMPIYTTADGVVEKVIKAGRNSSAGNYIRIKHDNGWVTQYMHLDKIFVTKGQNVSAGCMIGLMGHTGGNSDQKKPKMDKTLTHLHYEIVYYGNATSVTAPNGSNVNILHSKIINNGAIQSVNCGNFKKKIYPNKMMVYQ
jgi:murein DD-endopeptidase MepM/ murein hydrolase activator NlpD